jgi:hypothetical protein
VKNAGARVEAGDRQPALVGRAASSLRHAAQRAQALVLRKYWMFAPLLAIGRLLIALGCANDDSGAFEVTLSESA